MISYTAQAIQWSAYSDGIFQGSVNLSLLQEDIATACTPQHTFKSRNALTVNNTSDKPNRNESL
jgi:hypothetical protein